jgi:hypothetical protein
MTQHGLTLVERAWLHTEVTPCPLEVDVLGRPIVGDCWVWTACRNDDGYGIIGVDHKTAGVHLAIWRDENGPLPEGMQLDHLCRVRACWRPEHIELVTHAVNMERGEGIDRLMAAKTHCDNGHEFTEANTFLHHGRYRGCKTCRREASRALRRRRSVHPLGWNANQAKTSCLRGHLFDETNTHIIHRANGRTSRACRACLRDADHARRAA